MKKRFWAVALMVLICLGLTACGSSNPVDLVKNGTLAGYPGKPVAKTLTSAIKDAGFSVTDEWKDISEELSALDSDQAAVRAEYVLVDEDGNQAVYSFIFLVDKNEKTFDLVSIAEDGDASTDSEYIKGFLDEFFG